MHKGSPFRTTVDVQHTQRPRRSRIDRCAGTCRCGPRGRWTAAWRSRRHFYPRTASGKWPAASARRSTASIAPPANRAAGSLGSVESFLRSYEQAAEITVDRAAFRWWLVLATLRWGVICRYQAEQHILHATGHNGGLIALRACVVIKLGINGLISRIDEYFDPVEVAPLLS
jgi:hypothetical protein